MLSEQFLGLFLCACQLLILINCSFCFLAFVSAATNMKWIEAKMKVSFLKTYTLFLVWLAVHIVGLMLSIMEGVSNLGGCMNQSPSC